VSVLRVEVVADVDDDAGFVGERLVDRHGAELVGLDRDALPASPSSGTSLLLLLGSARSVLSPAEADTVESESALVRTALTAGVPVIGICYGAQLLAHALGGAVSVAPRPEIGWFAVTSADPTLCPEGPWAQFHSDAFTPPPGARVLGTSAAGCQGFAH
jgi:GMP synthase-like glutamine amidotransferase